MRTWQKPGIAMLVQGQNWPQSVIQRLGPTWMVGKFGWLPLLTAHRNVRGFALAAAVVAWVWPPMGELRDHEAICGPAKQTTHAGK
jgi:hypothetical protein